MEFQLLIKTKLLKNEDFTFLIHSDKVFILLINVKIHVPAIVGISGPFDACFHCCKTSNESIVDYLTGAVISLLIFIPNIRDYRVITGRLLLDHYSVIHADIININSSPTV